MAKTDLRKKAAQNIRKTRLKKKLTQEKAAEMMGFHYKYYQKIESGTVNLTLDSLQKISSTLKIDPKSLLS
jgi:transcriptional regulator with XRE-family HTH domain